MATIPEIIDELLQSGHPAFIHFPIIGIMMGMVAAVSALFFAIVLDIFSTASWMTDFRRDYVKRLVDRFEFASWILVFMGEVSLVFVGLTGLRASGTFEAAMVTELLSFKVKLTIYAFCILLAPLFLKIYFTLALRKPIFDKSRIIPVLYIIPLVIGAVMIMVISGAGGRYVYGHSILDTLGLGWLLPGE